MKTALALATLLGLCVAVPALARPDVAAADTGVRAYIAREGIPTAHVTIISGDEVILQRGFSSAGWPTPDAASVFPLGSISKQFTAATILALIDAGKVRLDASVGEYLPEWFADDPATRIAAYVGDGGLCGNAAALVRWIRFGLMPSNGRISRLALPSRLADGTQVPYGFGLSTREFLGHSMVWHGGNVDSHSSIIAYLPDENLALVILTSKGFVWLTELMPALLGVAPPARAIASGSPPAGRFEDGLFRYAMTPDGIRCGWRST